jgi:tetratricopeptide (TPR) repeat protein
MGQACLELALGYLPAGQFDQTVYWARQALEYLDPADDPESQARLHHLLGAAALRLNRTLAEAERHLARAAELTTEHDLAEIGALNSLELGNLLAQRGELPQALQKYRDMISAAQASGNVMQEVLGHKNLAYHAMLAGDPAAAQQHIEQGLELAETHSLFLSRQYLFSTRGEIALAEGELAEARDWFRQALAEAERNGNRPQVANIRANLGLVAREQDQLDEALMLLINARDSIADLTETHLQTQIDLWLAELHLRRGKRVAAEESLRRAEIRLAGSKDRAGLQAWTQRVRNQMEG